MCAKSTGRTHIRNARRDAEFKEKPFFINNDESEYSILVGQLAPLLDAWLSATRRHSTLHASCDIHDWQIWVCVGLDILFRTENKLRSLRDLKKDFFDANYVKNDESLRQIFELYELIHVPSHNTWDAWHAHVPRTHENFTF